MISLKDWTSNPLLSLNDNYESMDGSINQWQSTCIKLKRDLGNEDYDDACDVAQSLVEKLNEFKVYLPLIRCITAEAIDENDWKEIKEKTGNLEME